MKAVILGLAPEVTIVDISYQVPAFDVQRGAVLLKEAAPLFPDAIRSKSENLGIKIR